MTMERWDDWKRYLHDTFAIDLSPRAEEQFRILLDRLAEWNQTHNLVSYRTMDELLWRHCADSLAGLCVINRITATSDGMALPLTVADIGTGAGLPGFPVKIARPDIALTLIESITKKCAFLEHVREQAGIDAAIINDRLETVGRDPACRERFSFVLSRAVAKLGPNLEFALPLVAPGGYLLLYKTELSAAGPDGITAAGNILTLLGGTHTDTFSYDLPDAAGGTKRYCILVIRKTAPTPDAYPRRVGVPEKKPLA